MAFTGMVSEEIRCSVGGAVREPNSSFPQKSISVDLFARRISFLKLSVVTVRTVISSYNIVAV